MRIPRGFRAARILVPLAVLLFGAASPSPAAFTVTTTSDGGAGSLRQAILDANATPGADVITFSIGSGGQIILGAGLPAITDPVTIDATTQPGFAGTPIIELNGGNLGFTAVVIRTGNCVVRGLVINRCGLAVLIDGTVLPATGNAVQGCYIGTDVTGTVPRPNASGGIVISSGANNLIGGTAAGEGNLISGNSSTGITIQGGPATGNQIRGNRIGTDASGTSQMGNNAYGILLGANSGNTTIGGSTPGARNVIAAHPYAGISMANSSGNSVQGNYIGTNAAGTQGIGNGTGVAISSNGNLVGGAVPGAGNLISGNGVAVQIDNVSASGNVIQGNLLGTDAAGTSRLGNYQGIRVTNAPNTTIGGTSAAARNVISGNFNAAVSILGASATGTLVLGNFIGTDVSGTLLLGNGGNGVGVESSNNTIGGTAPGAGNVISGNETGFSGSTPGITLYGPGATGNLVQGNFIGTDVTGGVDLGNRGPGVAIYGGASGNTVGGTSPAARNVISGNWYGLMIGNIGTTGNLIQGNYVGTRADGVSPLGNAYQAFYLYDLAAGNTIGGTAAGAGNVIAFNGSPGFIPSAAAVKLVPTVGAGNAILSNSIHSNLGLGIDLGPDGATANDPGDADAGPNNLQNFPVITSALTTGLATTVQGALNSAPGAGFRIEFFSTPTPSPSGYGEGKVFLGFTSVTTDGAGDASFSIIFPAPVPGGQVLTATATDAAGNTSEFSQAVVVSLPLLTINDVTVTEGDGGTVNATFTVALSTACDLPVTVNYATEDGTAVAGSDYVAASGPLNFPAGTLTRTLTVAVTGDLLSEGSETFFVNLSGATNATIADLHGVGTIADNDPLPALSVNDVSSPESGSLSFTVSLSAPSGSTVTVAYATADGSATAGLDYGSVSGVLTFPPGTTTQPVVVALADDLLSEADETALVNLSGPVNAVIADGQGIGTITDNDPVPALSIGDVSVTEGSDAIFSVTMSAASGQAVTVSFSTADGTALAGSDYTAAAGTVTFPAGTTLQTVSIPTNADGASEGAETFTVVLSVPVHATIAVGPGTATITAGAPRAAAKGKRCGLLGLELLLAAGVLRLLRRARRQPPVRE